MKSLKVLMLSSFALALASPAFAQQSQAPQPGQSMPQQGGRPSPFDRLDTNRDGVITREEVRMVRTESFNRLDTNRDSFLVREEMMAGRASMGQAEGQRPGRGGPMEERRMHGGGGLAGADANQDGNITRAEFDAAMNARLARQNADQSANRDRLFAALDGDRNGSLSAAEIAAAPARNKAKKGAMEERPMGQGPAAGLQSPDTNNDGKVSLAEWLARPDPLFDRGDANNDGRLTREEAAAVVREGRGPGGRPTRPW
jgi:Ca2+-binding EF-hand superfamily protein